MMIHFVRDPRAIYRSYLRLINPPTKLGRFSLAVKIARFYFRRNMYTLFLKRKYCKRGLRYIRIRYEDLCDAPDQQMHDVFRTCKLEPLTVSTAYQNEVNHIIGGNVNRFKPLGSVRDERKFMFEFSRSLFSFVTLLNLPMILAFRYPVLKTTNA
ncbi:MAG: hypothetical protein GVY36_02560 [Verrucomicrobia bacterium]|nr:hypothetical protein [Verrucomicrobiota bacterium]